MEQWNYDLELVKDKYFYLKIPKRKSILFQNIKFQPLDICGNFFLAKTQCLIDSPWDKNLKLMEHEDFFWRLKQTHWKVFYTNYIQAQHIKLHEPSPEYKKMRNRMYSVFRSMLKEKYHINKWVRYEDKD